MSAFRHVLRSHRWPYKKGQQSRGNLSQSRLLSSRLPPRHGPSFSPKPDYFVHSPSSRQRPNFTIFSSLSFFLLYPHSSLSKIYHYNDIQIISVDLLPPILGKTKILYCSIVRIKNVFSKITFAIMGQLKRYKNINSYVKSSSMKVWIRI